MAEVAVVAGVYGLITGSIAIVRSAIDIYVAVQNKSSIPERLRKVSERLKPLEGLLESAKDQYDSQKLDQKTWDDAEDDLKRCQKICQELHDLLVKVYPEDEATKPARFWSSTKAVLNGKSKNAEQLLKEIWMYLDIFEKKGIITNMALLQEIKNAVDELFPSSGSTLNHSGSGDNVAGDKFTGNKYQQGDNGRQIFGSIGTYHEGSSIDRNSEFAKLEHLKNWLAFTGMHDREHQLAEPASETFGWILPVNWENYADEIVPDDSAKTFQAGSAFVTWLQCTDQLFWVSGKPGSGKSTLMKHLWSQESLRLHLERWAGGRSLQRSSHFFWKIGGGEQNTIRGLYRALLHKLCRSQDGERCVEMAFGSWDLKSSSPEPSMGELRHAMRELLSRTRDSVAFCFLIDGLDECLVPNNDHHQLCEVLSKDFLAAGHRDNVKLIISSRPDPPFGDTYSRSPRLVMQELTRKDIEKYVLQSLQEDNTRLILQPIHLQRISSGILYKSDGVFLWTVLVVRRLRSSMVYEYDPTMLENEVNEMPHEIYHLIGSIVDSVPSKFSLQCKELLILLRVSQVISQDIGRRREISATTLTSAAQWYSQLNDTRRKPGEVRHYVTPRLRGLINQTHGLLEIGSHPSLWDYKNYGKCRIWPNFMHRTVVDWVDANLMTFVEDDQSRKSVLLRALGQGMLDDLAICIQRTEWDENDKVNLWFSDFITLFMVFSDQSNGGYLISLLDRVCSDNLDQLLHLSRRHLETQSKGELLNASTIKHWSALCMKPRADWLKTKHLQAVHMPQDVHARRLETIDILLFAIECGPSSFLEIPSTKNQIETQRERRGADFLYAALMPRTYKTFIPHIYKTSGRLPYRRAVEFLLDLGCDPNGKIHKTSSVWHEYLRYLVMKFEHSDATDFMVPADARYCMTCIELMITHGADLKSPMKVRFGHLQERFWTPSRTIQWVFLDSLLCCCDCANGESTNQRNDPSKAQIRYRNIMRCTCPVARELRPRLEGLFGYLDIQDWSRSDWSIQYRGDLDLYVPKLCDNHRKYGPYWDNEGCTNFTGSHCDWTRPRSAVPTERWYWDNNLRDWGMEMEPDSFEECVHNPKMPPSTTTKTTQGASRWREWLHTVLYVVLLMILGPIFTAAMFAWLVVQFRAITLFNFVATNRRVEAESQALLGA